MARIGRSGRYDPNSSTTLIVRTNLRKLREMRGLTRDDVMERMEPPHMTSAMLAKVENGERSLSVEELVQLSVAYQVPVQTIIVPWEDTHETDHEPLSGAYHKAKAHDAREWMLHGKYPPNVNAIARYSSTLEGAANTIIFNDTRALAELSKSPTPETYAHLVHKTIPEVFRFATEAVAQFQKEIQEWLGFDPFPFFDDFTPSIERGWFPPKLIEALESIQPWTITKPQIDYFRKQYSELSNLTEGIRLGYFSDIHDATVHDLDQYKEMYTKLQEPISSFKIISTAVSHHITDQRQKGHPAPKTE